jgi:hypothetical protein
MTTVYLCAACGRDMLSPDMVCSGSFRDRDHPPNVVPVAAEPPVVDGPPDMG